VDPERELPQVVLPDLTVRSSSVLERMDPAQLHVEGTRRDQLVEPREGVGARHPIVCPQGHAFGSARLRLDAVRVRDAPASSHHRERRVEPLAVDQHERCSWLVQHIGSVDAKLAGFLANQSLSMSI
jgi:hypothetical protein